MKIKDIRKIGLILFTTSLIGACSEKPFGEDYDINLPVSSISSIEPATEYVDGFAILKGENLDMVTAVSLGNVSCEIIEAEKDFLKFKVNRLAERNKIVVLNKYKRSFESEQSFTPIYLDVKIDKWPSKLERGKVFSLSGENVDMIQVVKVGNVELQKMGIATPKKVTYSLKDVALEDKVVLTAVTRTNQKFKSGEIEVVEPTNTYVPASSIILCNFDNVNPEIKPGNASGPGAAFEAGVNLSGIVNGFGNYYTVKAPLGNAWSGVYQEIKCDNNGQGFDLSSFTNPYITFLVNTNGKQGYFNPKLTVGTSSVDKHFMGQGGEYTDNYKFITNGWEWRSYNLTEMGYNVKGKVDAIDLLIRGANIGNNNSEAFELNLDQVMITDGPLLPMVLWQFDALPAITDGSGELNGGSSLIGKAEGNNYLTIKAGNVSKWQSLGKITHKNVLGDKYSNSLYINFLVNTGATAAEGYFQLIFEQNNSELGKHFKGDNPYGDNYKFPSTNGEWQWRSYLINPTDLEIWKGDATSLNLSAPFDFSIEFKTGNVSGAYEVNLDYVVFTSVPLDNK